MPHPPLRGLLAVLMLACACASTGGGVALEHYEGVVTTHFGGIPEGSRVCARVHNGRAVPVEWVRLRLVSETSLGSRAARFTSHWVYEGRVEAGETIAVELPDAPVAERIELRVRRAGFGRSRGGNARTARLAEECSELWVQRTIAAAAEARPDADVDGLPSARPGEPDVLVATE